MTIYSNQVKTAEEIIDRFIQGSHYVILNAEMQLGKTGTIVSVIDKLEHNDAELAQKLGVTKFKYLTGDNQDIKQQTEEDFEDYFDMMDMYLISDFRKNSDCRGKKINNITNIKNAIIAIDESQYGTKKDRNVLPNFLTLLGINHLKATEELKARNIYVISVSATPWIEIMSDICERKDIVNMEIPTSYIGIKAMIENNVITPISHNIIKDCFERETFIVDDVLKHLKSLYEQEGKYRCAIIRATSSKTCPSVDWKDTFSKYFNVIEYSGKNINSDGLFYKILTNDDKKPLLIIIKGTFRMGKRIPPNIKDMIGVVYDYSDGKNIETTAQGLLGRMCGHVTERRTNAWKDTKIYVSSKHYEPLYDYYINGNLRAPQESEFNFQRGLIYRPIIQTPIEDVHSVEFDFGQITKLCGEDWYSEMFEEQKNYKRVTTILMQNIVPSYRANCNLGRRLVISGKFDGRSYTNFNAKYNEGFKKVYNEENVESGKLFYPVILDLHQETETLVLIYQPFKMINNPESKEDFIEKTHLKKYVAETMITN